MKQQEENNFVSIQAKLPVDIHAHLLTESSLSRYKGKKKTLPEVIVERLKRDLENYPVLITQTRS